MKKIFSFILFSISTLCNSQNLTLDELVSLRKKSLVSVEESLSVKGWNYIKGDSPEFDKLGSATFAYKKSSYDDKAQSFITYFYSDNSTEKKISIQINSKEKYTSYLTKIKALGCKLIDSEMSEGSIIKTYQGKTTTFKIEVTTVIEEFSSSTKTLYYIVLLDNKYYNRQYLFEDVAVDTTSAAVEDPVYEEAVEADDEESAGSTEEILDSYNIGKEFFSGNWSCDNFTVKFFEDGTSLMTHSNTNNKFSDKWNLISNKIFFGDGRIFYIKKRDSNSFTYSLTKDGEWKYAYRIGN